MSFIAAPDPGVSRRGAIARGLAEVWNVWVDLPLTMHLGLLVIFGGTLFDIWAHWSAGDMSPVATRFTAPERIGHWVILLGMVISISGVIARGYRRPATPDGNAHQ